MPLLAGRPCLTLDDFDLRAEAGDDPEKVLARAGSLVIEEIQRATDFLPAVRRAVEEDESRTKGRFVLTASANPLLLERVGKDLQGRAASVTLWPFTRRERRGLGRAGLWSELLAVPFTKWAEVLAAHDGPAEDWRAAALLGGLPVPASVLRGDEERAAWYSRYVQTYLERDLQALCAVEKIADFRRLMRAACLRIGGLVNQSDLGRDAGVSQPQVHRFLKLMEASYLAIRLRAYPVSRTRRVIKAPKLYWSDTALALTLAGESEPRGPHLENLVLMDLLAWRDAQEGRPEVLHWRTASGLEVDFVVETPKRILPIEVTAATRVTPSDALALEAFLDDHSDLADGALLLHGGTETFTMARRVLAAPWWRAC